MDYLYEILPKDLAYIIDDYAKDRTEYDKVVKRYQELLDKSYIIGLIYVISNNDEDDFHLGCECKGNGIIQCRKKRYNYVVRSFKQCYSNTAESRFKINR